MYTLSLTKLNLSCILRRTKIELWFKVKPDSTVCDQCMKRYICATNIKKQCVLNSITIYIRAIFNRHIENITIVGKRRDKAYLHELRRLKNYINTANIRVNLYRKINSIANKSDWSI